MATYTELYGLRNNSVLRNKIAVAVVVAAQTKLAGSPSAAEAKWAVGVVTNPNSAANAAINLVLAANKDATVEQILEASNPAIQSNVDAVIDGLVLGEG
jgi:hypothetical protein